MAGTVAVTYAPSQYMIGRGGAEEVTITLTCTSDASAGTIPDQALTGLGAYYLKTIITKPTSLDTGYRLYVVDSDSGKIFLSDARDTAAKERFDGYQGTDTGAYPDIFGSITVQFVSTSDLTAANVGNSKALVVNLVFGKRDLYRS